MMRLIIFLCLIGTAHAQPECVPGQSFGAKAAMCHFGSAIFYPAGTPIKKPADSECAFASRARWNVIWPKAADGACGYTPYPP